MALDMNEEMSELLGLLPAFHSVHAISVIHTGRLKAVWMAVICDCSRLSDGPYQCAETKSISQSEQAAIKAVNQVMPLAPFVMLGVPRYAIWPVLRRGVKLDL